MSDPTSKISAASPPLVRSLSGLVVAPALLLACALAVSCGGSDSTPATDGGTPVDAGTDAGTTAINGCSTFEDHTSAGDSRSITFTYPAYTPPCMHVAVGQTVTFSGTFASHPLTPGVSPTSSGASSSGTPITLTSSGSSATFTFATPGTYAYYCGNHYSFGMYGAIEVQ